MSFRVHVLGSGSAGNSILLETAEVRLLIDIGFSGRQIERRLEILEIDPESVTAAIITHEHRDHTRGMGVFARRWGTPLYLSPRTARSCAGLLSGRERVRHYTAGRPIEIGDLRVEPFLTCHDAVDPLAVAVRQPSTGLKVGVATDLGTPTIAVRHALQDAHLLILEANHDDILLREGPYPWSVKSRIASRHGHLSNRAAAQLACELAHPQMIGMVLAHLSQECNEPELAEEVVGRALEDAGLRCPLWVAGQQVPLADLELPRIRHANRPAQLSLL